ncbi:hypothetical protein [uncultured Cohaesibacter sp.]|uniref:hypothetical protein n=1 Tax=uncultured Cohaesibacter sp. TaxID=1002546 RepID=UPI0029309FC8|nr:hypothetical protein [uncultured Cohaesibacter sp.]
MLKALRYFWKEQPIALVAFIVALLFLAFFGVRFTARAIYFHNPVHRNQTLEPWMTPKYVGMSYHLPPHIIREVMQLDEVRQEKKRVRLKDVTSQLGISLSELEARIREAKQQLVSDERLREQEQDLRKRVEQQGQAGKLGGTKPHKDRTNP